MSNAGCVLVEVHDLGSVEARDGLVYMVRFNAKLGILPVPRSLSGAAELRIHHVSCLGNEHAKLCNLLRCRCYIYCSLFIKNIYIYRQYHSIIYYYLPMIRHYPFVGYPLIIFLLQCFFLRSSSFFLAYLPFLRLKMPFRVLAIAFILHSLEMAGNFAPA